MVENKGKNLVIIEDEFYEWDEAIDQFIAETNVTTNYYPTVEDMEKNRVVDNLSQFWIYLLYWSHDPYKGEKKNDILYQNAIKFANTILTEKIILMTKDEYDAKFKKIGKKKTNATEIDEKHIIEKKQYLASLVVTGGKDKQDKIIKILTTALKDNDIDIDNILIQQMEK